MGADLNDKGNATWIVRQKIKTKVADNTDLRILVRCIRCEGEEAWPMFDDIMAIMIFEGRFPLGISRFVVLPVPAENFGFLTVGFRLASIHHRLSDIIVPLQNKIWKKVCKL
jgi:hypothetical protein